MRTASRSAVGTSVANDGSAKSAFGKAVRKNPDTLCPNSPWPSITTFRGTPMRVKGQARKSKATDATKSFQLKSMKMRAHQEQGSRVRVFGVLIHVLVRFARVVRRVPKKQPKDVNSL